MPGRVRLLAILLCVIIHLSGCATAPVSHKEPAAATIAVWDMEDLTPGASTHPDLGVVLSAKIIETIEKMDDYVVVERERLLLALEELNLGTTSLVEEATRLELGRLLQARLMVFGGYQVIGNWMRLDLRLVHVETGKIVKAVQKTVSATNATEWIAAAAEAATELI